MDRFIIYGFILCIINFGYAQEDTLTKSLDLKSITIQGAKQNTESAPKVQESTDDLLSSMPELTMIKRGNYALEPTIRGLNASQINMTIDGMQMFGACTDRMDPISSYIEPTNLKAIQLETTSNAKQTSSSTGGGINFSLMKAKINDEKNWSGKAGLGYETNANLFQGLGSIQYSSKKWAVLINGVYKRADNYHASRQKEILFSQFEKWNAGINIAFQPNEKHIFYADYIQDEGYNIGYPALTMDVGYAKAYISALTHVYRNSQSPLRRVESKVFFNYIDHTMDDTKRPAEMVPMHMDMPGTSRTFGMYSSATLVLGRKHFVNVNVNAFQNDLHAEMTMYPDVGSEMFMLTVPDGRRRSIGLTIGDTWRINSDFRLSFGGRLETSHSDITTEIGRQTLTSIYGGEAPRFDFSGNLFTKLDYKLNKNFNLFVEATYSQRPGSLQEMYGFYLFNRVDNYDYIGNPEILNEKSLNGNIGMQMKYDKVSLTVVGFANRFTDYVTGVLVDDYYAMTHDASGVKQYQNISNALLLGGEITAQWDIYKDLKFKSVNSYVYGVDHEDYFLPYIPPFKSQNSLVYNLKGYHIGVEYLGALSQRNVSFERYGETKTPGYSLFNLSVHKHFQLGNQHGLHASLRLENLFDTPYYEHLDIMKIQRQGFNVLMRVTWEF